jgi:hypothetical protein
MGFGLYKSLSKKAAADWRAAACDLEIDLCDYGMMGISHC